MRSSTVVALAASVSSAMAQYKGFNYGSTDTAGAAYAQADFESLFNTAKGLVGTSGFTSARLYTMIQGGTDDTVISAIPAAIATETNLLLGLWASGGDAGFQNELTALKNAASQYGAQLAPLLAGISVGSEDLYRISPPAVQAGSTNPGAEPSTLVNYIQQVRTALQGTALSGASIGHVDTWTAWVNGSNDAVTSAVDWVGVDAYPYFQNTQTNGITEGASLFEQALGNTTDAAQGKPVWVTETGWPVSGPTENLAIPSTANAQTYWDQVGCDLLFGKYNTFWYTLQDYGSSPSFGVVGQTLSTTPLYDLSCSAGSSSSSSAASSATSSATSAASSVAAATVPTTVPTSATTSLNKSPVPGPSLGTQSGSVPAGSSAAASATAGSSAATTAAAGSSASAATSAAVSTTVSAVTTGSATSVAAGGKTMTVYHTTLITITSCSTACPTTLTLSSGQVYTTPAPVSASASSAASAPASGTSASTSAAASSTASGCPADLNGSYQYPHLIVPVSSSAPNTAYGTQYNASINSTTSAIFNFDIPSSYAGKTCSLVFLFPEQSQLETSAYTFNGQGGLVSHVLNGTASQSTSYANAPAQVLENGAIASLKEGNSYVISTDSCPANTAVSFELSSTNGLALEFFEDYNPSPLGLYVRAC